jgi:hypothetical protein
MRPPEETAARLLGRVLINAQIAAPGAPESENRRLELSEILYLGS